LKVLGMHPNALQVDPKIVMQDVKFHAESESAEDAFIAMEDSEVLDMHERFVVAHGGKVPVDDEVGVVKSAHKKIQAESTYAVTKSLLLEGRGIKDISDARDITETTVWTHIEKLADDGDLSLAEVSILAPTDIDWENARSILDAAMVRYGTEKLKPIYEAADEVYDYTQVRLARIQFLLENKEAAVAPF